MYLGLLAKIAPTVDLNMTQTFGVIISGLVVVFLVLVVLVGFVQIFGSFFDKKKTESTSVSAKSEMKKPEPVKAVAVTPVPTPAIQEPQSDNDEVIAVISAVIAQMSAEDGKQYKIKSVKARNTSLNGRPVWAVEGLRQNTNPF